MTREEIPLSEGRTTVDRTEPDAREWERDRVAWNLPRKPSVTSSKPAREAQMDRRELRDSTEGAAEDG
jgi:hypothetical protein